MVVHADLGRVEWAGTRELAARQAAHYGVRFEVVRRAQGDLLDQVAKRGMWPSSDARYCTSDHKRSQVRTLMTALARETAAARIAAARPGAMREPCRILNCMGLRAQESPARAKRIAFRRDEPASNGRRHVDEWLPILDWTVEQVWARIRASGVPHHPAYDKGMSRLSCVFCIFAPDHALLIAGAHNRALLDAYVAVEDQTGHAFRMAGKKPYHLRVLRDRLDAGERATPKAGDDGAWNM